MSLRKTVVISAFLAAMVAANCLHAQGGDPKSALEQRLKEAFPPTKFSANKSDVVTAGAVVVLQRDKLMTYAVASPMPPINTYKTGKISQGWGGFGRDLLITTAAGGQGTANDYPHQEYVTGQTLWVGQIAVNKDDISFVLVSDPDANNIRYYAQLKIPFRKGSIPSPDDGLKSVSEVLTVQPASGDNSGHQPAPDSGEPAAPSSGQHAFAPLIPPPAQPVQASLPPLQPPPPPTDASPPPPAAPKTISLGQTKDQVIATFGQPQKAVHVGPKEIDFYQDMKVTLVNGKVTDVQ